MKASNVRTLRATTAAAVILALSACSDRSTPGLPDTAAENIELVTRRAMPDSSGRPAPATLTFRVTGASGAGVANVPVAFSATGGGSASPATAQTDATGEVRTVWSLGGGGSQALEARIERPSQAPLVSSILASAPGSVPSVISVVSGGGQSGPASYQLAEPLVFKVSDALGVALPAVKVNFAVTAGGGAVRPESALTDFDGLARTAWTLGALAGTQTMEARVSGVGVAPLTATAQATALANVPARLTVVAGQDQLGNPGMPLPDSVTFLVTDASNGPMPAVKVLVVVTDGGGSVRPESALTDFEGRASVSWTLGTGGMQTITARVVRNGLEPLVAIARSALSIAGRIAVPDRPFGLAVNADGLAYATRLDAFAITAVRASDNSVAGVIEVGATPTAVAFNPAGTRAYVANQFSQSFGIVDVATGRQIAAVPVLGDPFNVLVSADGSRVIGLTNIGWVYSISTATGAATDSLFVSHAPNGLAFSKDGTMLYVSTAVGGSIHEISLATFTEARRFTSGGRPQALVLSPDGGVLYLANEYGGLEFWDLASGSRTAVVPMPEGSFGLTPSPDGRRLYVSNVRTGSVYIVDPGSRAVVGSLALDGTPRRLGFTADGRKLVIANEAGWVNVIDMTSPGSAARTARRR